MSLIHLTEKLLYRNKTLCKTWNKIISHGGQISVQIRDFHLIKEILNICPKDRLLKLLVIIS